VEEVVLSLFQQDQPLGPERRHLPAQFRPDGPPGACHEDDLAGQEVSDVLGIEFDGFAAEEVVDVDLAEAADVEMAFDEVGHAGHDAERQPLALADLDDASEFVAGGPRQGDDDFLGVLSPSDLGQVVHAAEHRHAVNPHAALPRVVVDEPDDVVLLDGQAVEFAQDALARVAGADDEHARQPGRADRARALPNDAHQEPQAAHQRNGARPVDDQHRVGHLDGRGDDAAPGLGAKIP